MRLFDLPAVSKRRSELGQSSSGRVFWSNTDYSFNQPRPSSSEPYGSVPFQLAPTSILWIPLLFFSWLLGTISVATADWKIRKRIGIGIVVSLVMLVTAGYIVVAHRQNEAAIRPAPSKVVVAPIEPNTDPSANGLFAAAVVRLYDTPELRRKYVFDFLAPTGSHASFYVSPSDVFVFSVTDVNKEPFSLEIPISSNAIPLNRYFFLYCEVALHEASTVLRIVVDGKQIDERTFGVRVELGKDYWKWTHATFGADANGENNAPFKVATYQFGHKPLTDAQVFSLYWLLKSVLPNIPLP